MLRIDNDKVSFSRHYYCYSFYSVREKEKEKDVQKRGVQEKDVFLQKVLVIGLCKMILIWSNAQILN